jgi:hypothetical protein
MLLRVRRSAPRFTRGICAWIRSTHPFPVIEVSDKPTTQRDLNSVPRAVRAHVEHDEQLHTPYASISPEKEYLPWTLSGQRPFRN